MDATAPSPHPSTWMSGRSEYHIISKHIHVEKKKINRERERKREMYLPEHKLLDDLTHKV